MLLFQGSSWQRMDHNQCLLISVSSIQRRNSFLLHLDYETIPPRTITTMYWKITFSLTSSSDDIIAFQYIVGKSLWSCILQLSHQYYWHDNQSVSSSNAVHMLIKKLSTLFLMIFTWHKPCRLQFNNMILFCWLGLLRLNVLHYQSWYKQQTESNYFCGKHYCRGAGGKLRKSTNYFS